MNRLRKIKFNIFIYQKKCEMKNEYHGLNQLDKYYFANKYTVDVRNWIYVISFIYFACKKNTIVLICNI